MHEVIVNPTDGVSIRLITPDGTVLACVNAFHHDTYTTVDVISPPRGRHDVKALVFDFSAGTNQAPEYSVNPQKSHHSLSAPMGLVGVLVKPVPASAGQDVSRPVRPGDLDDRIRAQLADAQELAESNDD